MLLNPYLATTGVGSGGGGPTYFFEERFEGTGYDSSNANGWTESGTGTINEDYTTSPLEGSQSLQMVAAGQAPAVIATLASDQDELWAFFRFRINTSAGAQKQIFTYRNSSATQVGAVYLNTSGTLSVVGGSTGPSATTDAMTNGVDYNVWFHWIKGTGSDGFGSVGFSSSGTEPTAGTSYRAHTTGNSTTDAHDIRVGYTGNATVEFVIDQILVSTTATIGNSPA